MTTTMLRTANGLRTGSNASHDRWASDTMITTKMNPEIKAMWIDALRSSEYEQGAGHLHTGYINGKEYFCCLGVLCDIAIKNGVVLDVEIQSSDGGAVRWMYNGCTEYLPLAVAEWAGITTQGWFDLVLSPDGEKEIARQTLAELNDEGYSFGEIAEEIEAHF